MIKKNNHSICLLSKSILKRTTNGIIVLLGVAILVLLGLYMARQGSLGLPATLGESLLQALQDTYTYIFHHPEVYVWHKQIVPAGELVRQLFFNSAGLLFVSLMYRNTGRWVFGHYCSQAASSQYLPACHININSWNFHPVFFAWHAVLDPECADCPLGWV